MRHACRRFLQKAVPTETIDAMLQLIGNAPNGGNKQQVEFTLIDDRTQMDRFHSLAYTEMDRLAAKDVYPKGFDKPSYVLDKKLAVQCLPVLGGNAPRQKR